MKKLFALAIVALLAIPMMASKTIPTTIYGMELGVSTFSQVVPLVNSYSKSVEDNISTIIGHDFEWGSQHWDMGVFSFDSIGHLASVVMTDSVPLNKKSFYDDLLAEMTRKYGPGDDDAELFLTASLSMVGIESSRGYAVCDGKNFVALVEGKAGGVMFMMLYDVGEGVKEIADMAKTNNPNYDPANRVTGVAGFVFGDTKQSVRSKMYSNSARFLEDDGRVLEYADFSLAGNVFSIAKFYFADRGGKLVLVAAHFEKNFATYEKSRAQTMYDNLLALYGRKYTNLHQGQMDDGSPLAVCGMSEDYTGAPISMYMSLSTSVGGQKYYYVTLDYFFQNQLTIYNDDI